MKFLIICSLAKNTGGYLRGEYLTKSLREQGHEVVYVKSVGSYPHIFSTKAGQITSGSKICRTPNINDAGEIVWAESKSMNDYPQLVSNLRGQLTSDSSYHLCPDLNDKNELVWTQTETRPDSETVGQVLDFKIYKKTLDPIVDEICDGIDNNGAGHVDEGCCTGDLNADGSLSPLDAMVVFQCYLGFAVCPECADVNKDGSVTPLDAFCLFSKYLGQPCIIVSNFIK